MYVALPSENLWSASIPINSFDLLEQSIRECIYKTNQNFFGFVSVANNRPFLYTRTRYPRKKYENIPSIEEINYSTNLLANKLNSKFKKEVHGSYFRVVLGANIGYDSSVKYSIQDVFDFINNRIILNVSVEVLNGEIFSITKNGLYRESAFIIYGDLKYLKTIYELADEFKQHRFCVEDFSKMKSYIVETRHCLGSDLK